MREEKYNDRMTVEEIDKMIEDFSPMEDNPIARDFLDFLKKLRKDLPEIEKNQKELLTIYHQKCPNHCGKIDFEKILVEYDEQRYTEWRSNYSLNMLEVMITVMEFVGMDYEIRLPDEYIPEDNFAIYFMESEEGKMELANELVSDYVIYHIGSCNIEEYGSEEYDIDDFKEYLKDNYDRMYEKVVLKPKIFELKFENREEVKYCIGRMDSDNAVQCIAFGFRLGKLDIPAEKFASSYYVVQEDGRDVYYFEFPL